MIRTKAKKHIFRLVAVDESGCWNFSEDHPLYNRPVFGAYMFREYEATHVCSFQPNTWAIFIQNFFIFDSNAEYVELADIACEFDYTDGRDGQGCYLDYIDPAKYDPDYLSSESFTITVKDDEDGEREAWDAAEEWFKTNGWSIPITDCDHYWQKERERHSKRLTSAAIVILPQRAEA